MADQQRTRDVSSVSPVEFIEKTRNSHEYRPLVVGRAHTHEKASRKHKGPSFVSYFDREKRHTGFNRSLKRPSTDSRSVSQGSRSIDAERPSNQSLSKHFKVATIHKKATQVLGVPMQAIRPTIPDRIVALSKIKNTFVVPRKNNDANRNQSLKTYETEQARVLVSSKPFVPTIQSAQFVSKQGVDNIFVQVSPTD